MTLIILLHALKFSYGSGKENDVQDEQNDTVIVAYIGQSVVVKGWQILWVTIYISWKTLWYYTLQLVTFDFHLSQS